MINCKRMAVIWAILFLLSLLYYNFVYAANDVDMQDGIIRIGTIDGTAWTWTDTCPDATNGLYIWAIFFHPGVTGDKVVLQTRDANGVEILSWTGADIYDDRVFYGDPGKQYKLYIDPADLNDDALIIIHTR